ncbi:hypothetical protein [Ferrimonas sp. SCSIO 43195]|uniref:hypothetical protein n=1 Tax=Ferrimonas sp. SCSIO 43195 TaxID=2822844 RepID=UPI00207652B3|nr:hypothetical protein [Ferrimonas sp. SCSIO 43195]USD36114.1 hypothetical protein J8Z22_13835 [Ferrimonas sp. SCSIO 43195]
MRLVMRGCLLFCIAGLLTMASAHARETVRLPIGPVAPWDLSQCQALQQEWKAIIDEVTRRHHHCLNRHKSCKQARGGACSCGRCETLHTNMSALSSGRFARQRTQQLTDCRNSVFEAKRRQRQQQQQQQQAARTRIAIAPAPGPSKPRADQVYLRNLAQRQLKAEASRVAKRAAYELAKRKFREVQDIFALNRKLSRMTADKTLVTDLVSAYRQGATPHQKILLITRSANRIKRELPVHALSKFLMAKSLTELGLITTGALSSLDQALLQFDASPTQRAALNRANGLIRLHQLGTPQRLKQQKQRWYSQQSHTSYQQTRDTVVAEINQQNQRRQQARQQQQRVSQQRTAQPKAAAPVTQPVRRQPNPRYTQCRQQRDQLSRELKALSQTMIEMGRNPDSYTSEDLERVSRQMMEYTRRNRALNCAQYR